MPDFDPPLERQYTPAEWRLNRELREAAEAARLRSVAAKEAADEGDYFEVDLGPGAGTVRVAFAGPTIADY